MALVASAVAPTVSRWSRPSLLAGIAAGVAMPAIYASAAAIAPPGRESGTIGVVLTGWTLSMVAGVSLSAVLADLVHWRAVFAAVALLATLALGRPDDDVAQRRQEERPGADAAGGARAFPAFVPLLIACAAFMTAFYGVYGYLGDHLHSGLGEPVSANGWPHSPMASASARQLFSTASSIGLARDASCRSPICLSPPSMSPLPRPATVSA